jgi:hypothetical protein
MILERGKMSELNLTSDQSGNPPSPVNPFTPSVLPTTPITPSPSLSEFQYYSQYSNDPIGIVINVLGVPTNTDNGQCVVAMYPLPLPGTQLPSGQSPTTPVFMVQATNEAPGVYQTYFTNASASVPGFYRIDWSFTLNGNSQVTSSFIQIGVAAPAYDNLPYIMKQMVEQVWLKISDGYDSPNGGPNLQMWMNSHFGRGRVAQLLYQAIQHLNNISQPQNYYSADGINGGLFPVLQWSGLLNSALTVEVIKHLMRAYVEDPDIQGNVQARMVRRDYLARWGSMLSIEQEELREQRETWKIRQMFQGQPRVMVSGGVFGKFGPIRPIGGSLAAYPNFAYRFYT